MDKFAVFITRYRYGLILLILGLLEISGYYFESFLREYLIGKFYPISQTTVYFIQIPILILSVIIIPLFLTAMFVKYIIIPCKAKAKKENMEKIKDYL